MKSSASESGLRMYKIAILSRGLYQQVGFPPPLSNFNLGAHRGLQECRNQFANDSLWNCTFDWKHVDSELPVFVNSALPCGKIVYICDLKI